MELKNIFKMELYKNRNNKPYLIVIAVLTVMAAASTFLGVAMIENKIASEGAPQSILISLITFTVLGLAVFTLLYPFHLLNVDYRNKVVSLIFASGVSREKYYFVKTSATIITFLFAMFVILLTPSVTFLLVYPEAFVEFMQKIIENFSVANITSFMIMTVFSFLAYYVTLTTSVIITKGKVAGIFLFLGISFAISTIRSTLTFPLILTMNQSVNINLFFNITSIISILQIVLFAFIGLKVLKKQDL